MARYAARHAAAPSGRRAAGRPARAGKGPRRGHRRGLKVALGAVVGAAALCTIAYGAGLLYFQDHFLPRTTVNGRDVSLMSEAEVASAISSSTDDYTTTIEAGDFSYTVTAADIGLTTDGETAARDALSQVDLLQWPYLALMGSDLEVTQGVSYDEQRLADAVGAAVDEHNAGATQPVDATWAYDEGAGEFAVVPEVAGDVLVRDAVVDAALEGVGGMTQEVTCDDSAEVAPARTSADEELTSAVGQANAMISSEIPLTYDGEVKATVSRDQLAQWVSIGDDLSVSVDRDAVASYVSGTVSEAVDTEDDENRYTVAKGSLTGKIVDDMESGSGEAIEIPVKTTAKPRETLASDAEDSSGTSSTAASGDYESGLGSYVDVDLSSQEARYYDAGGNVLWYSSIVSGDTSEGHTTPTGTYQINDKATDVTLVGADTDGDGEPDYRSHVDYWMPFIGNSIGLHDATWRGSFGGTIYEYSGSHGCVNLPYSSAQELFGLVSVGTTVRVHY